MNKTANTTLLALALMASGCGGGGGGGTTPPPSGGASDCFNADYATVGTTFLWDSTISGFATGTASIDGEVTQLAAFAGQTDAVETELVATTTRTVPGSPAVTETNRERHYARLDGTDVLQYGRIEESVTHPAQGIRRTVWTPSRRDNRASLTQGQSTTLNYTSTATTTLPSGQVVPGVPVATTDTIKYTGQETITIPAGTFEACRFETTSSPSGGIVVDWIQVGKGSPLKTVAGPGTANEIVIELLDTSRLNGAPL